MQQRFLMVVALLHFSLSAFAADSRPNIIFILADDLGYGDLSSYGATDINTPNIDRLAKEGIRFTDHYTPANTCSPTRAALLTGRYPARTGVNAVISYDSVEGLPGKEITLAEVLREAGYTTAMIGKWHLGQVEALMPWQQGFDSFFGVATSNDDYNFYLYESSEKNYYRLPEAIDQTQLTRRYTGKALDFLRDPARTQKPFFLYLAHTAAHIPLHPHPDFVGRSGRGLFGDVVQELDDSVGQVLRQLDESGLADNTIVVFTSDNGAWRTMRDHGGSNGILREGKLTAFEGGHRVPALVRWPQRIPGGRVNGEVVTVMDWFVTLGHYAQAVIPGDRVIDGKTLRALLEGTGTREQTPFFYFALRPPHEQQTHRLAAVREGQWKLKRAQRGYYPHWLEPLMGVGLYRHGDLLFDLSVDPGERHNLIGEHPDVARRLEALAVAFDRDNPMPVPANINAGPRDGAGWEKLWMGIAQALALMFALAALLLYAVVKLIKRLRR